MKRKMDIMTLIGFAGAVAVIFFGTTLSNDPVTGSMVIRTENLSNFFDVTSLAIVVGGTFTALFISFPIDNLFKIPGHLKVIFMPNAYEPNDYINKLVEFAKKARINGLLALEEDLANIDDPFLKSSMVMVVDSVDPEKVKQQLEARMDHLDSRHAADRSFYAKGAAYSPAFGMFGTMFGLINMLKDLSDVSSIGPNMSVCLITTFYGIVLANVIFNPINNKLAARHDEEMICTTIISEGVQAIQAGENPKFIQERLMNLLPQYQQKPVSDTDAG